MAHYAGRHLHQDGTYSLLIDPSAPKHASGYIALDSGEKIAWSSPNGRDVYVEIGAPGQGFIHEDGFPDVRFALPYGKIG